MTIRNYDDIPDDPEDPFWRDENGVIRRDATGYPFRFSHFENDCNPEGILAAEKRLFADKIDAKD